MYIDGQTDLRPDFRLSRSTVAKLIDVLRSPFDHSWGLEVEVLVYLFWLASTTSYRLVSRGFSIPQSIIYDIVHRMSDKILSLKNRTIKFPSLVDIPNIAAGFQRLSGSPALQNVVGSIDGCHIRIKSPGAHAHCYFNRKLFYSIQLQAVCDHQGLFIDIFTGYPGSVHDARVLGNSPLYVQGLYPPEGYCIVGDGGYPCMSRPIALVTPYREPLKNMMVARFNRHHAKARSVMWESKFGTDSLLLSAPTHLPPALQDHDCTSLEQDQAHVGTLLLMGGLGKKRGEEIKTEERRERRGEERRGEERRGEERRGNHDPVG
ncbi:hypothetical protein D4764_04G0014240 [Takifugu flavidus]|uniref:DDE Tnp4 domain-containing protein n=1 Tax=Takifugu flavidus TaxID=433684 RepID=A0A5C6NAV4_9TELE|nr:hypothetical protein D4764_04G0014240 [Takifugu flavidus]